MKIKFISTFIIFFFFLCTSATSQTLEEALLYSNSENIGTARMLGAGGAFGALGGEQGALIINPATIATYKKGEFAISPMNLSSRTTTTFQESSYTDNNASNLHFFNMGAIFSTTSNRGKWKTTNFGVTYNKISELDRRFSYEGVSEGTIVERFAERANGLDLDALDPFEAGVAYDSDAIFDLDGDLNYSFDALVDQETNKSQTAIYTGGISELAFTLGGNYNDQLHLGVSFGIPIINYSTSKVYEENALDDRSPFRSLAYSENLAISGNGINFKAGAIFTGIKQLRIGVSVASPSVLNLSDEYSTSMNYTYEFSDGPINKNASSIEGEFEYGYSTPWKYTGSLGYVFTSSTINGFLSADIDYLNYTSGSFDLTSDGNTEIDLERDLNEQINRELSSGINLRLGGEIAYDIYRIRLGYGLNSTPYIKDNNLFTSLSGGFGLRFDKFYFDLGARNQGFKQGYLPYVSLNEDNVQLVQLDTRKTQIVTTFGIKF